jgi:hypothetical protein
LQKKRRERREKREGEKREERREERPRLTGFLPIPFKFRTVAAPKNNQDV